MDRSQRVIHLRQRPSHPRHRPRQPAAVRPAATMPTRRPVTDASQREPRLPGSRTRAAPRRPPARGQRVDVSGDDSDDEDVDERESQGSAERSLNMWLRKTREEAEAVKMEQQPVYVKTERGTSQSQGARGQHVRSGPSRGPVIDLTGETTDDDPTGAKGKSGTSSQRSLGTKVKGKPATPRGTMDRARVRVQQMMSGGSGKSENDSIDLLDSEEDEGSWETVCRALCGGDRALMVRRNPS